MKVTPLSGSDPVARPDLRLGVKLNLGINDAPKTHSGHSHRVSGAVTKTEESLTEQSECP